MKTTTVKRGILLPIVLGVFSVSGPRTVPALGGPPGTVRVFMARDGQQGGAASSGPTQVTMVPSSSIRLAVWMEDTTMPGDLLGGYHVLLPILAAPQPGATGTVTYLEHPPTGSAENSVRINTSRPDWAFAGTPALSAFFNESPGSGIFGLLYSMIPGSGVNLSQHGIVYLGEFELLSSPEACGSFQLAFHTPPALPLWTVFSDSFGNPFAVDELQTLTILVNCAGSGNCITNADCNDNDACTTDICNVPLGVCVNDLIPGFDPLTECCDPATGVLVIRDDANACTGDTCSLPDSRGVAVHSPTPGGSSCDDGLVCTVADSCDGLGICAGVDVNTIVCVVDSDCPAGICSAGFCSCTGDIAPVNDDCIDQVTIFDGLIPFDTTLATTDGSEEDCNGVGPVYNDIWFTYTATCTGILNVNTCENAGQLQGDSVLQGAAVSDTKIAVYPGTSCLPPAYSSASCNDDSINTCGSPASGRHSEVEVLVTLGDTYVIRVGGAAGPADSGPGLLALTCQENPSEGCPTPLLCESVLFEGDAQIPSVPPPPAVNCSRLSADFAYYNDISNYVPDATTPVKVIDVAFNIFQKTSGMGNFQNNTHPNFGKPALIQILNNINGNYQVGDPPSDPIAGIISIPDRRIQFSLGPVGQERIFFYQDDALWNGNCGDVFAFQNAVYGTGPQADPSRTHIPHVVMASFGIFATGF